MKRSLFRIFLSIQILKEKKVAVFHSSASGDKAITILGQRIQPSGSSTKINMTSFMIQEILPWGQIMNRPEPGENLWQVYRTQQTSTRGHPIYPFKCHW